jgi:hypothetical protein
MAMRHVLRLQGHGESHVMPLFLRLKTQFALYTKNMSQISGNLAGSLEAGEFDQAIHTYLRAFYARIYGLDGSFVDKTPGAEAIRATDIIFDLFPDARVLLLRRTGIEVIPSYRRKFGASFEDACRSWVQVAEAMAHPRMWRPEVLTIDQFDLTNNAADVAERIASHLRCPERAADLAAYFEKHRFEQQSTHDWSRRQLLADTDWNEAEKDAFRRICGKNMTALGYEM